jgi:hypothetical protein
VNDASTFYPDAHSEAAIFARVVESSGELSRELAEHVLKLSISAADQERVGDLLERNAQGALSDAERQELDNYNHIADLISLWHSRARRVLKRAQ